MTEKLSAWCFLMSLVVLTLACTSHRRWSLDARPVLIPIQHVTALIDRGSPQRARGVVLIVKRQKNKGLDL